MRFHHSTRRGRNRLSQQQPASSRPSSTSTSRWSQLGYCRETNIHFHRRLPVEPPAALQAPVCCAPEDDKDQAAPSLSRHGSLTVPAAASLLSHRRSLRERRLQPQQQVVTATNNQESTGQQAADGLKLHRLSLRDSSSQRPQQEQPTSPKDSNLQLDMDSVRQKLVAQVEKHPFWSSRAAKRMHLTGIQDRRVLIYELTSFCERRDLEWRYESYRGGLGAASAALPYRRVEMGVAGSLPGAEMAPARAAAWARSSSAAGSASTPSPLGSPLSIGSGTVFEHPQSRASVRRCSSQAGTPATPTSAHFEPLSAIERPQPSAEFVWSIEPLDLTSRPVLPFTGRAHSMELPGSSFVKRCHGCQGRGRLKCTSCYGVGYEVCLSCSGKGSIRSALASGSAAGRGGGGGGRGYHSELAANPRNSPYANGYDQSEPSESAASSTSASGRLRGQGEPGGITGGGGSSSGSSAWASSESCHYCHGAGQKRCWVCAGKAYNHCLGCLGAGQLRCYLQLNITWLNHRDESVLNNSDNIIPRDRLRLATGKALLEEVSESPPLKALTHRRIDGATNTHHYHHHRLLPEAAQLQHVSGRLLEKHLDSYRTEERILRQRQRVTQVECHLVSYEWKQQHGHFVIYGDERKVYIAKYPFKSFCNIT